jgi:hypothetical protein
VPFSCDSISALLRNDGVLRVVAPRSYNLVRAGSNSRHGGIVGFSTPVHFSAKGRHMGIWDTMKGWFNIGGVSVKITKVENPFPRDDSAMKGNFTLTTKIPKTVLGTRVEFFGEETTKEENKETKAMEEKTKRTSYGVQDSSQFIGDDTYPMELAAGETRQMHFFMIGVHLGGTVGRMAEQTGVLGALGKAAAFAGSLSQKGEMKYYVEVTADVKGTPFDPSDKVEIRVIDGKS